MESISLRLDKSLLKEIDDNLKKNRYSTRTEFVRDAVRDKLESLQPLTDNEKEEMKRSIAKLRGISKKKTTDEDLHRIREKAFEDIEKRYSQ